ncbi:hypothetical protein FSP39_023818 [Pinctada imbricata]|uniref:guanylate cyclase n=1 Tax=Pinctada imbricata TaxID=66713 RepID=A0AA88Y952_PINIB|nr:hypothetical protein FSP39_023818 [Pinctada imbricata]
MGCSQSCHFKPRGVGSADKRKIPVDKDLSSDSSRNEDLKMEDIKNVPNGDRSIETTNDLAEMAEKTKDKKYSVESQISTSASELVSDGLCGEDMTNVGEVCPTDVGRDSGCCTANEIMSPSSESLVKESSCDENGETSDQPTQGIITSSEHLSVKENASITCPFSGRKLTSESSPVISEKYMTSPGKELIVSVSESDVSRKISQNSNTSNSSSDDPDSGERKLDLVGLIESVGTLLLPTTGFIDKALEELLRAHDPDSRQEIREVMTNGNVTFSLTNQEDDLRHKPVAEDELIKMATMASSKMNCSLPEVLRLLGVEYVKFCLVEYGRLLSMMGSNMVEFFSNLDGIHEHIRKSSKFNEQRPPSFRCESSPDKVDLHIYTERRYSLDYYAGIVISLTKMLFNVDISVEVQPSDSSTSPHHILHAATIKDNSSTACNQCNICSDQVTFSRLPSDLKIGVATICETFPFHFIIDKNLNISQLGSALLKVIAPEIKAFGTHFLTYFKIKRPIVEPVTFSALLSRVNFAFVMETKSLKKNGTKVVQEMEIKGQLIDLKESNSLLFVGSPSIEKLDELINKGLYISDVPIHDATRDVILVGEQTKAQDGLRKRMEQIKQSILEGYEAVTTEKKKNVDLLNMIFPEKIAMKLWKGETITPTKVDDVTMLFSDIVGFTAICSSCTPMEVIRMLNSLYTQFDYFCGVLDVYKVETIGDAYCVAGGLERRSKYHAQRIAWMALKMMAIAKTETSHDGSVIRMRIGLHSGSVLAGVVGVKMPRYCLFGNNVNLANKFESGSVATKINISPTTYQLLQSTEGFEYTARTREDLPEGFPEEVDGVCYFLDGYKHPCTADDSDEDPIVIAVKEINQTDQINQ